MARATKLTELQKAFVVQRLACYDTPEEVAKAVKEELGVEISRQAIESYDPTKRAGESLAKKWRALFKVTREAFETDLDGVPESKQAVRVRRLARMSRWAEARGNFVLASSLIEQIAKEMGSAFTNRRELTGRDGGPVRVAHSEMSDEQLEAELSAILTRPGADAP